jgi:hypothetical protein
MFTGFGLKLLPNFCPALRAGEAIASKTLSVPDPAGSGPLWRDIRRATATADVNAYGSAHGKPHC